MHRFPPPSAPRSPDRWHTCRHPVVHGVGLTLALGGWLYWALVYGWRWAVMQSQAFGPGMNLLMYVVFGVGWLLFIIPCVATAIVVLGLGDCTGSAPSEGLPRAGGSVPTPHVPPGPGRRTTERIIFSPEAAEKRFGIRGTIIVERETED